jgi:hypothetical protein
VLYELVHLVCENPDCGLPGVARARASTHPRDIEVECPACRHTTVVACAGLGPIWRSPDDEPEAVEEETWLHQRRRMIGIGGRGSGTNDWYGAER